MAADTRTTAVKEHDLSYSGSRSRAFWKGINAIPDNARQLAAYAIGCELQDAEARALREIARLKAQP